MAKIKIHAPAYDGLVAVQKKPGLTSFDTLHNIKSRIGHNKVGHTGTLDKFASGLLLALVGNCTRLTPLFLPLDKEYRARICFGTETETLDPEGNICRRLPIPSLEEIKKAADKFIGVIDQIPPLYSALHINGERAYSIARRGGSVEIAPRKIRIDSIRLMEFNSPYLTIDVCCSGGTYIRSLARDIGEASGSCAYLAELERVRIGNFSSRSAVPAELFSPEKHIVEPYEIIEKLEYPKRCIVENELALRILHGRELVSDSFSDNINENDTIALFDEQKNILAIVKKEKDKYKYLSVMNRSGS
jgi:tRNA pseudouridine55 synthase